MVSQGAALNLVVQGVRQQANLRLYSVSVRVRSGAVSRQREIAVSASLWCHRVKTNSKGFDPGSE